MGFSQLRRPQNPFHGNALPQTAPMFGGPSAHGMIGDALHNAGVLGAPSPAAKLSRGVQPLPSFLDAPSEQQVSTDPKQNFQRSLNLERGNTANAAAVFAANAPLPMRTVAQPAVQPTAPAGPDMTGIYADATQPIGVGTQADAPAATPAAPTQEYSGAFGNGPVAQQTAEAARAAYIARQAGVATAQNFGAGQNYYANESLRQDWNDRENQDADTRADAPPDAKEALQRSQANRNNALANAVPAMVDNKKAATDLTTTKTGILKDQAPALADKTKSQTDLNNARKEGVETNTDTAAHRENRLAGAPNPAAVHAASDNAKDMVAAAKAEHKRIADEVKGLESSLNSFVGNGPTMTKMKAETQAKIDAKNRELAAAKQKWDQAVAEGAKQRGAAVKPTTRPTAGQSLGGPSAPNLPDQVRELKDKFGVRPSMESPSQADLEYTAKKYGITVEEVKRRIEGPRGL